MSTSRLAWLRSAAAASLLLGSMPLTAQQINTGTPPPSASWPVFSFGRPGPTQYSSLGQSFTVDPGLPTQLTDFTFWVNQVEDFETLPFRAYVFPFDPTTLKITGGYLFRSAQMLGTTTGPVPLSFAMGGIDLVTGQSYLAVLSSAEFAVLPTRAFGGIFESTGGTTSTYAGGRGLARISAFSDGLAGLSSGLNLGKWGPAGSTNADLAFTATFVAAPPPPPSTVPEPSTIVLLAAGLLGIGALGRRRRTTA